VAAVIFLIIPCLLLLPNWLLLVWGIPFLQFDRTSLLSIGGADIRAYDIVMSVIALKVACFLMLSRHRLHSYMYAPICAFLTVLLVATLLSYSRFGYDVFKGEIVAFTRFLCQFIIFALMAHSILTTRQLELADNCIYFFGLALAASVYIGLILFTVGIQFGETSIDEYGNIRRFFGPLGDQVSYLLPLFLYRELIKRRIMVALFFGMAILLTGTRGALIISIIGLAFIYKSFFRNRYIWKGSYTVVSSIVVGIMVVALSLNVGGMWARFMDREVLGSGFRLRGTSAVLATEMFLDNILTGVGFSGFKFMVSDYSRETIFSPSLEYSPNFEATPANQYLQVATDAGILGLILFLWMIRRCLGVLRLAQKFVPVELKQSFEASYIWMWSLLIGAQGVVWMLPDMTMSYILWMILGMASSAITIKCSPTHGESLPEKCEERRDGAAA
jgi:hypothetical protein